MLTGDGRPAEQSSAAFKAQLRSQFDCFPKLRRFRRASSCPWWLKLFPAPSAAVLRASAIQGSAFRQRRTTVISTLPPPAHPPETLPVPASRPPAMPPRSSHSTPARAFPRRQVRHNDHLPPHQMSPAHRPRRSPPVPAAPRSQYPLQAAAVCLPSAPARPLFTRPTRRSTLAKSSIVIFPLLLFGRRSSARPPRSHTLGRHWLRRPRL